MSNDGAKNNRYRSLISNTVLFAIGGFSSKFIAFFLQSLFTRTLATGESGIANNIQIACNFLLPLMHLCIHEAIIRFGMQKEVDNKDIYTTSITVVMVGYVVMLLLSPLINMIPMVSGYSWIIMIYIITSAMHTVSSHFARAEGHVRLFAFDGVLTTVLYTICNFIFLAYFKMGIIGFLLATIIPDAISSVILTVRLRAWEFFSLPTLDKSVARAMIKYSLPLVPAALGWVVTNGSDKYVITALLGEGPAGIYGYSDKIPQVLILVSAVFIQAWQISAFAEDDPVESEKFFSTIFRNYSALIFVVGSALIIMVRPIIKVLLGPAYQEAWRYTPVLVISVMFSCLVTFLGTIYNYNKKNAMVTITTVGAGIGDVILNFIMIPWIGVQGATISTFISYFAVFLIRLVDTRKYMKLKFSPVKLFGSTALMLLQIYFSVSEVRYGVPLQAAMLVLIIALNSFELFNLLKEGTGLIKRFIASRRA